MLLFQLDIQENYHKTALYFALIIISDFGNDYNQTYQAFLVRFLLQHLFPIFFLFQDCGKSALMDFRILTIYIELILMAVSGSLKKIYI